MTATATSNLPPLPAALSEYYRNQETPKTAWVEAIQCLFDKKTLFAEAEEHAKSFLSSFPTSKRYEFTQHLTFRQIALNKIFRATFQANPDVVIQAAEETFPTLVPLYPSWKKICWVHLPQVISDIVTSPMVKGAILGACIWQGAPLLYQAYNYVDKLLPLAIEMTPELALKGIKASVDFLNFLSPYQYVIIYYIIFARTIIVHHLPPIPHVTEHLSRADFWAIPLRVFWSGIQSTSAFILTSFVQINSITTYECGRIGSFFGEIARRGENDRLQVCSKKTQQLWNQIVAETAPNKTLEVLPS